MNYNTENEIEEGNTRVTSTISFTSRMKDYVCEHGDRHVRWIEHALSIAIDRNDYETVREILTAYHTDTTLQSKVSLNKLYGLREIDHCMVVAICEGMGKNYIPYSLSCGTTDETIDYLLSRDSTKGYTKAQHAFCNVTLTLEMLKRLEKKGVVFTPHFAYCTAIYEKLECLRYIAERGVFPTTYCSIGIEAQKIIDEVCEKQKEASVDTTTACN